MRVVHYLNQFFGGIGGEEKADAPPQIQQGVVGPGRLLESVLPSGSKVIATVICGDNYAAENMEEVQDLVVLTVQEAEADLLFFLIEEWDFGGVIEPEGAEAPRPETQAS